MPTEYTVENIDKMLNEFHMPTEIMNLIDGLVHRVMEISDNDTLVYYGEGILGGAARRDRLNWLTSGSYSSGTLRDEDMITMFGTIGRITKCHTCRDDAHKAWLLDDNASHHEEECLMARCTFSDDARDERSGILEALFDHVDEIHTPDGHYFGSIEGDGAEFGVWEMEEE